MKDFRDLKVWEKSHALTLELYKLTKDFPSEEKYGLISEIRRAGYSVPNNIAEGCGKKSQKDFGRFLGISFGSASEVEYLLLLSSDLNYIEKERFEFLDKKVKEVKKMLAALINKIDNEL